jgi:type IV pilus assembly protein PilE
VDCAPFSAPLHRDATARPLTGRSLVPGRKARRRSEAFTLIELMITVVVVAILAAIAYPSYERHIMRGRRSQAEQLMGHIAMREEQYMLDARAYTATIGAGGLNVTADGWTCTATCANGFYTVAVAPQSGPPPTYSITAQATGSQSSDGNLTLGSDGSRSRSAGDGQW